MTGFRRLIAEVHRRSLWQVLAIYLGAGWLVFEVVEALTDGLNLPEWVPPLAIVLLLVGLPIVMATAFVQEGTPPLVSRDPTLLAGMSEGPEPGAANPTMPARPGRAYRFFTWRNAIAGGALAFAALFGAASAVVVMRNGEAGKDAPSRELRPDPGVAILPFEVSGPNVDFWRDGMADLLATNLDGLGGWRSIEPRVLAARLEGLDHGPASERALAAARQIGAMYAVVARLVSTGSRIQIAAEVYDVGSGEQLGRSMIQGPADPDSAFELVDRLTLETVRHLPNELDAGPIEVDLAARTTNSPQALREYLVAERHFLRGEWDPAVDAFRRAVELDSTFALAHYRLSSALGWAQNAATAGDHDLKAVRHGARLPERHRLLAEVNFAWERGEAQRGIEIARQLTRRYPDAAEAWYFLGEQLVHFGGQLLIDDHDEAMRAFRTVRELAPDFFGGWQHLVDLAWLAGDRALIDTLHATAPDYPHVRRSRAALQLMDARAANRAAIIERIETDLPGELPAVGRLLHYAQRLELEQMLLEHAALLDRFDALHLAGNHLMSGELRAALIAIDQRDVAAGPLLLYAAHAQGLPVAIDSLERAATSLPDNWFAIAAVAVERRDQAAVDSMVRQLTSSIEGARAVGDELSARHRQALLDALRGFQRWRTGDPAGALEVLMPAQLAVNGHASPTSALIRYWIAQLHEEAGELEEAARHYRSVLDMRTVHNFYEPAMPIARLRLAEVLEAQGRTAQAARHYATFVEHWRNADAELRSYVEHANTRLAAIARREA